MVVLGKEGHEHLFELVVDVFSAVLGRRLRNRDLLTHIVFCNIFARVLKEVNNVTLGGFLDGASRDGVAVLDDLYGEEVYVLEELDEKWLVGDRVYRVIERIQGG